MSNSLRLNWSNDRFYETNRITPEPSVFLTELVTETQMTNASSDGAVGLERVGAAFVSEVLCSLIHCPAAASFPGPVPMLRLNLPKACDK
ncbi:hypothetical protein DPEC_G00299490 [Dallia pectoralis]|uniref:Uncharacterized protein n=1 Tax=Dallia pectoralis TaxID=75939 RepID=A0ACC2FGH7_DALPE|nr:hypothetical protein DPEC_G00299490 [Dallia pectoralis]